MSLIRYSLAPFPPLVSSFPISDAEMVFPLNWEFYQTCKGLGHLMSNVIHS